MSSCLQLKSIRDHSNLQPRKVESAIFLLFVSRKSRIFYLQVEKVLDSGKPASMYDYIEGTIMAAIYMCPPPPPPALKSIAIISLDLKKTTTPPTFCAYDFTTRAGQILSDQSSMAPLYTTI